jgi:hypothetical protein
LCIAFAILLALKQMGIAIGRIGAHLDMEHIARLEMKAIAWHFYDPRVDEGGFSSE